MPHLLLCRDFPHTAHQTGGAHLGCTKAKGAVCLLLGLGWLPRSHLPLLQRLDLLLQQTRDQLVPPEQASRTLLECIGSLVWTEGNTKRWLPEELSCPPANPCLASDYSPVSPGCQARTASTGLPEHQHFSPPAQLPGPSSNTCRAAAARPQKPPQNPSQSTSCCRSGWAQPPPCLATAASYGHRPVARPNGHCKP